MAELATAYLTLIPTLKGAGKQIASELGGVDVSSSGRRLGKSLGDSMAGSFSDSGVTQLQNAVSAAEKRLRDAMNASSDATRQVEIAQMRLNEARERHGAGSSQAASAELKLSQAQRKSAQAADGVKSAEVELDAAQKSLKSSTDGLAGSFGRQSGSMSGFSSRLSAVAGVAAGFAMEVGRRALDAVAALGGEMMKASDSTQKFASTLSFAGIDDSKIKQLTSSTQEYADRTVYELSDIRNVTAQLASNSVADYERLAQAAGNLNAVAGGNAETFKSVGMVLTQTAGAGKLTTENWNQLADAIPGASGKLQEAMLRNGAYTGNFREAMEKGEISAEEFNRAIMDLGLTDVAEQAATSTSTYEGALGNLQAAIVGVGAQVFTAFGPIATGAISGFAGAISSLPGFLSAAAQAASPFKDIIMGTFGPVLSDASAKVIALAASIWEAAQPAISGIAQIVAATLPYLQVLFQEFATYASSVINAVFPFIQAVVTTAMNVINAVISTVLALVQGNWSGVWTGIQSIIAAVWDGICSIVNAAIGAVAGVIGAKLEFVKTIWNGAWSVLGDFLNAAWNGFVETVSGGNERVMGLLRDLPGKVIGIFSGAGSWLIDAGSRIIGGLLDGLKSKWSEVTSFIGGIGDWIVSHKGPPSYDAVMLVENGQLIMDGLLRGMRTGWGDVEGFVRSRNVELAASVPSPSLGARDAASGGSGTSVEEILLAIYRALPAMIRDNSPSALTVDGREFARAVRRYA